jgi:hypothetical protein
LRYLKNVEETCIRHGGDALSVSRVEITYINLLKPDTVWGSFRDIEKVVSVKIPGSRSIEQLNVAYSRSIEDESGGFFGRLHTAITTVWQPKRLMQNPNYSQSGVSQGSLSRKLATRRMK